VDVDQVFAHPEDPGLAELKLRQIAFSDMVVLNNMDLAGQEQVEKVKAWIDDRISNIRIVEASYCQVPYEILLGVGRFDPRGCTWAATATVTTVTAIIVSITTMALMRITGGLQHVELRVRSPAIPGGCEADGADAAGDRLSLQRRHLYG
jgi:G3E family GTPase